MKIKRIFAVIKILMRSFTGSHALPEICHCLRNESLISRKLIIFSLWRSLLMSDGYFSTNYFACAISQYRKFEKEYNFFDL